MVQGRHIAVTLDTCYVCHFKGLKHGRDEEVLGGCTSCHSAPKSEIRLTTGMFDHADYVVPTNPNPMKAKDLDS